MSVLCDRWVLSTAIRWGILGAVSADERTVVGREVVFSGYSTREKRGERDAGHVLSCGTSRDNFLSGVIRMKRILSLGYGVVCYLIFHVSFLYAIGFLGGFVVPKTVNSGTSPGTLQAVLINTLLLGLFGLQHSVMARPGFKRLWTKIVPGHLERSTYVLFASLILLLIFAFWQPLPAVVWDVQGTWLGPVLWGLFGLGWCLVVYATFEIDHFDLFGLSQVWSYFQGRAYEPPEFQVAGLYRYVRHPIMTGFVLAFWAIPTMTVGHALFSGLSTAYIVVGVLLEERDLMNRFGERYARYRAATPMLIPGLGSRNER